MRFPDVEYRKLTANVDDRGELVEIFRRDWVDKSPVQWNCVTSIAESLRGVHVHLRHIDHLVVLSGVLRLGTCDLRESSANFMKSQVVDITGSEKTLVTIPTGVAHGFYFPEPTIFVYGVSEYWDPVHDELGCMWNDADLQIDWRANKPVVSERDRNSISVQALLAKMREYGNITWQK